MKASAAAGVMDAQALFLSPELACKGTHVDDPPVSRTPHEREDLAGYFEHSYQVDPNNAFPF